nr:DUF916 domain-containing protein [Micromonospora sp. DSM 115978]
MPQVARPPRTPRTLLAVGVAALVPLAATIPLSNPAGAGPPTVVPVAAPAPSPALSPTPGPTPTGAADAAFTWAVQPSGPEGPTGRNYFVYDLAPGDEINDQVRISNLGDRPMTFAVYGTDAFTTVDGAFALLPADQPATGVGSWIRFAEGAHTVAPGRWVDLPFRLTVPANATPGDHVGGVLGSVAEPGTDARGQRVNVDRRVAARVYLRVAGEVRPAIEVESMSVHYDNPVNPFGGGDTSVTYRLRNTGNVRVGGTGAVTVDGPFGWRLARTDLVDLPELLPGGTFSVTERITGVPPALRLTAVVDIAPTTVDAALPPVVRTGTTWAPPWLLLAALFVLGVLAAARRHRRRRSGTPAPAGSAPAGSASAGSASVPPVGAAPARPTAPC